MAPVIEDRGIDEIYIDLTELPGVHRRVGHDRFGGVRAVAQEIRTTCARATGLTCSIGVTPNKLLSKIASDLDKPDGLTLLTHADMPARDLAAAGAQDQRHRPEGGGEAAGARHRARSANWPRASRRWLIEHFGRSYGGWLHEAAHGRDERPVVTSSEPVSISRETTFDRDLHARARPRRARRDLHRAVRAGGRRPAAQGLRRRTIGIKLRFDDFKTVTRDLTLPAHRWTAARSAAPPASA